MRNQRAFLLLTAWMLLLAPGRALPGSKDDNSEKRPIELQDILDWKSIRQPVLSDDGKWLAYQLAPAEGDSQVIVRSVEGDQEYRFPIGQAPSFRGRFSSRGASSASLVFSPDSTWAAFTVYPTADETRKARPGRRPSSDTDDGEDGAAPRRPPAKLYNKAALVNLSDGEKTEFEKVRSFSFSGELPGWIALHKYAGENQGRGKEAWKGSDLLLYRLDKGAAQNIGNVAQYAFNKTGERLAWTVDAQGKDGNGVQLRHMKSGAVQVLDSGQAVYEGLNWTKQGDGLAVLKGVEHEDYEDPLYSLIGFKGFDQASPSKTEFDPSRYEGFPQGMTISPNRRPAWSEDLEAILFGIHEVEKKEKKEKKAAENQGKEAEPGGQSIQARPVTAPKPKPGVGDRPGGAGKKEEPEKPDLVIWHWRDERMQSEQQVQEDRDKNFSYLAAYHPEEQRFVRLADDSLREVEAAPRQRWAVGTDRSPYQRMSTLDGRRYFDLYAVDIGSGERRLAVEKARWQFGPSPDGSRLLYYQDGDFYAYEMESGKRINLTKNVPASFIDTEDDHNVDRPPTRPLGWSSDSNWVLLSDNWDIWKVPADSGKAVNLTVNGKKDSIRYQARYQLDPDEEGIDLAKPLYIRTYGEWTKKGGISRIADGSPGAEALLWDDATFPRLIKARHAETFVLSRGTFADYPDFHATDQDLQPQRRLTEANPQQGEFLWSAGSRLIDYTGAKGDRLQAALHLPAGYEPGKRYPAIVYIYERLSQRLNQYSSPSANGFNKSVYTSHGYAVLEPDIAYQVNDPGMSAVWCVLPALQAAIESGVVDPEKVGLHGHSWGGYQTAFLITQSKAFSAAVAGAPLTNMISMYSSIYWNTGSANQPIFESSQGRFTGGYWEVPDAYTRNSPVYFADQVETPLLILHNDKDGAVDWNQGIEYFNTLRRLEKPVVMLQYKGENHGLRKPANQKDYTLRMKAFFDHYLKGSPAPEWLEEGIPLLDLEEHLKARAKEIEKRD